MIEVLNPGLLTTVQDQGRKGYESFGMPPSGAFDPFFARIANRLVGNEEHSALLEFALSGPRLAFEKPEVIAFAGAGITAKLNGSLVPDFTAVSVAAGSVLEVERMEGWFGYFAVSGGVMAPGVLGSASTYVAGRIGKRLSRGDRLRIGEAAPAPGRRIRKELLELNTTNIVFILPAIHTSLFTSHGRQKLTEQPYLILPQSNRMGVRLDGAPIVPPQTRRSVPALPGTIQIPRTGLPILLGPEGPTTGGYAQIGIICRESWTTLAATPPGKYLQFEWTEIDKAIKMWEYRNRIFQMDEAWEAVR